MMDFTPPKYYPPRAPEWATYVPKRRPKFKIHNGVGQAKNALSYENREGILYQLQNNEWVEVTRRDGSAARDCAICGVGIGPGAAKPGRYYDFGYGRWIEKPRLAYLQVCRDCYKLPQSSPELNTSPKVACPQCEAYFRLEADEYLCEVCRNKPG